MQVVLRADVESVGLRGDVVNVARGYARNYLLPRGLAELATPGLVRELEKRDAQRARHEAQSSDEARAIAQRLEAAELRIDVKAGPTGSLFGSVTATNIVDRLWDDLKIRIDRRKLDVGAIKRIGRYTVPVAVFNDVQAELRLLVVPEGGELPPEEELQAAEAEAAAATAPNADEAPAAAAGGSDADAAPEAREAAPRAGEALADAEPGAPGPDRSATRAWDGDEGAIEPGIDPDAEPGP
jgi:large subunit ribosomal protein L9